jgi:hypothetical protein
VRSAGRNLRKIDRGHPSSNVGTHQQRATIASATRTASHESILRAHATGPCSRPMVLYLTIIIDPPMSYSTVKRDADTKQQFGGSLTTTQAA